jgi:hypothetical protein
MQEMTKTGSGPWIAIAVSKLFFSHLPLTVDKLTFFMTQRVKDQKYGTSQILWTG